MVDVIADAKEFFSNGKNGYIFYYLTLNLLLKFKKITLKVTLFMMLPIALYLESEYKSKFIRKIHYILMPFMMLNGSILVVVTYYEGFIWVGNDILGDRKEFYIFK